MCNGFSFHLSKKLWLRSRCSDLQSRCFSMNQRSCSVLCLKKIHFPKPSGSSYENQCKYPSSRDCIKSQKELMVYTESIAFKRKRSTFSHLKIANIAGRVWMLALLASGVENDFNRSQELKCKVERDGGNREKETKLYLDYESIRKKNS